MNKMLIVMRQEYINRVRTRGFVIGTVLFPVFMVILIVLPGVFMSIDVEKPVDVAVVDSTGIMLEPLQEALADTNKAGERLYTLLAERPRGQDREALVRELGARIDAGELGGFLIIPDGFVDGGDASLFAKNVADPTRNERLERALAGTARQIRIERSGLSGDQVREILQPVHMTTYRVGEAGEAQRDEGQTFIFAYMIGFLFYMSLFMYGAMTLRTTLEEKLSRSAELMVSTVRPVHLMGGKVLGVAAVGLTQLGIWFVSAALILNYGTGMGGQIADFATTLQAVAPSFSMILLFFVFFVLGFLFYSGLFVSVGAMVNSETEAQQMQLPVTLPIILSLMLMFLAIRDPDGTVVRVLSLIPFFTPILMTVRVTVLTPPAWEVLLAIVILGIGLAGSIWLSGRIFRVGLLMYGKRPSLPELMKWIRYG